MMSLSLRIPTGLFVMLATLRVTLVIGFVLSSLPGTSVASEWTVPLGGNAFHTAPSPSRGGIRRTGITEWYSPKSVYSVYFRADRPSTVDLKLVATASNEKTQLLVSVASKKFDVSISESSKRSYTIGKVKIPAGYVRVDIQSADLSKTPTVRLHDLLVATEAEELRLDFVKPNKGSMFYWGRRGPSVHLRYEVPAKTNLRYAYSELTVPTGQDPIGSYFMANGFGEGYFGMQVNSEKERRVLFSVWSPFKTDNPKEIPKEQRIEALASGRGVHIGEFGNEGSGGQSYLRYPWKSGKTYRFLTEVTPDGKGNTVYQSWFGDKAEKEWRLIARFRRPQTDTHLRGFHSFLESFSPSYGHIGREGRYGNVWVVDTIGNWHECTRAKFSVDATGAGRHRLDFSGGSLEKTFFLRNCGFFSPSGSPGKLFQRKANAEQPQIDFASLPRH